MEQGEIDPKYQVIGEEEMFGIFGEEKSTGEKVFINRISPEPETVFRLMEILNKNKVSIYHAKDIIKDLLLTPLYK